MLGLLWPEAFRKVEGEVFLGELRLLPSKFDRLLFILEKALDMLAFREGRCESWDSAARCL